MKFCHLLKMHPAFWMGMLMLGCCGLSLGWSQVAILPWLIILLFPWAREKKWTALIGSLLLGIFCFFYTSLHIPQGPQREEKGICYFRVNEIKQEESPFGKNLVYRGKVLRFEKIVPNSLDRLDLKLKTRVIFSEAEGTSFEEAFSNLPCKIYIKTLKTRPKANADFLIFGSLVPKKQGYYIFKPQGPWTRLKGTFSLAEWRYVLKQKAQRYLENHFGHSKVSALFSALALGNVDDRQLASDFRNLGLSHLLAISGFHFALALALLTFLLKPLLPRKPLFLIVFIFCSLYALFLGFSPSILRAWAALSLLLLAYFLDLRTTGLNALGFGLIVELLVDPTMPQHLGFALSFLATAAILLLYSPCERLLRWLFPLRTSRELQSWTFLDQHLYLISSFFRTSLALNLSVHLVVLPACLLFFHSFSCLSLLYNLFFPLCIGMSLALFFLTIPIDLILPAVGASLHKINHLFAQFLLNLTSYSPFPLKTHLSTTKITPEVFSFYLLSLGTMMLYFDKKRREPLY